MSAVFTPPELTAAGDHPTLVWRLPDPMRAISSAPHGGGIGLRHWVLNVQVPLSYDRLDPDDHLAEIADHLGLRGPGVGFLTAATIERWTTGTESGAGLVVRMDTTVGISKPTWAAADDAGPAPLVGTINLVGRVNRRLSDAALVNAVATITEAKAQAMVTEGVAGTGTASDAVCVLCPPDGVAEPFGGPRSVVGAPLARVTFAAVRHGVRQQLQSGGSTSPTRERHATA